MLTFKGRGKPLAVIVGGEHDGRIVRLFRDEVAEVCCVHHNAECEGDCCDNCSRPPVASIIEELLDDDMIERISAGRKLTRKQTAFLDKAIRQKRPPEGELKEAYEEAKAESLKECRDTIELHDDGVMQPLPAADGNERSFVAGPTFSGKSWYVAKYLMQIRKANPDKQIFIISDVEKDHALDGIKGGVIRVVPDEGLATKGRAIPVEKFADSVVVFDDIDTIKNKKVAAAIATLRDSVLRRGRHENITCLVTSHMLADYKNTRIILNECNSVTVYPRSGAWNAIVYVFSKYCGLTKAQIADIQTLPSRWVTVYKHAPMYVVHEKGIYML